MATLRVPEAVPSPEQDCERLHKAFQGPSSSSSSDHKDFVFSFFFHAMSDDG